MSKKFFVMGTGTGIGKTYLTTSLGRELRGLGKKVSLAKPVISGWDDTENTDTAQMLAAMDLFINQKNIHSISPWRFKLPISPHLAAKKENLKIDYNDVVDFCLKHGNVDDDFVLIEGAGGVMTPITESKTYLDLMVRVKIPVLLVVGTYVGSISHTLTAVAAMAARRTTNIKIIINETPDSIVSVDETEKTLVKLCDAPIFKIARGQTEGFTNIVL